MATGIIIAVLIVVCVTAIKSYMNKLAHGCCGAGSDDVKAAEKKTDLSEYKYKTTVHIGGMSCKNCAEKIANALNRQGLYAEADYKSGIAEVYSASPVSDFTIRQTVIGLGYTVERTEENEL